MSAKTIRLLLADDHPVTLAGLRAALKETPDIEVVGEAEDGIEAMRLTAELRPTILLLDLKMPGPRPADIERWVRENYPETITLVLTAHDRNAYLTEMMDAGVAGYLTKGTAIHSLVEAIRRAAHGEVLFDQQQVERARRWRKEIGGRWYSLSQRERQIVQLIAAGKTDRQIADELHIKKKTVNNHISQILEKLNVASRIEAAMWAMREGFIDQDDVNQGDIE